MNNNVQYETETEALASVAVAGMPVYFPLDGEDHEGEGVPLINVPAGYSVESLERYLPAPARIRAVASLTTVESFCRYVGENKLGATRLFADLAARTVTAVIDYHGTTDETDASWCSHRAALKCSQSLEWLTWMKLNKTALSQQQFAEHIEDNYLDIIEPDNATILEISTSLEARKEVKFRSGVNLSDGTIRFTYDEQQEGKGKGDIEVPQAFTLSIPIFEGDDPQSIKCRLRYRIKDGVLSFVYLIERPERLLSDAFKCVLSDIEVKTDIEPLLGSVKTE